eukprot:UN05100
MSYHGPKRFYKIRNVDNVQKVTANELDLFNIFHNAISDFNKTNSYFRMTDITSYIMKTCNILPQCDNWVDIIGK